METIEEEPDLITEFQNVVEENDAEEAVAAYAHISKRISRDVMGHSDRSQEPFYSLLDTVEEVREQMEEYAALKESDPTSTQGAAESLKHQIDELFGAYSEAHLSVQRADHSRQSKDDPPRTMEPNIPRQTQDDLLTRLGRTTSASERNKRERDQMSRFYDASAQSGATRALREAKSRGTSIDELNYYEQNKVQSDIVIANRIQREGGHLENLIQGMKKRLEGFSRRLGTKKHGGLSTRVADRGRVLSGSIGSAMPETVGGGFSRRRSSGASAPTPSFMMAPMPGGSPGPEIDDRTEQEQKYVGAFDAQWETFTKSTKDWEKGVIEDKGLIAASVDYDYPLDRMSEDTKRKYIDVLDRLAKKPDSWFNTTYAGDLILKLFVETADETRTLKGKRVKPGAKDGVSVVDEFVKLFDSRMDEGIDVDHFFRQVEALKARDAWKEALAMDHGEARKRRMSDVRLDHYRGDQMSRLVSYRMQAINRFLTILRMEDKEGTFGEFAKNSYTRYLGVNPVADPEDIAEKFPVEKYHRVNQVDKGDHISNAYKNVKNILSKTLKSHFAFDYGHKVREREFETGKPYEELNPRLLEKYGVDSFKTLATEKLTEAIDVEHTAKNVLKFIEPLDKPKGLRPKLTTFTKPLQLQALGYITAKKELLKELTRIDHLWPDYNLWRFIVYHSVTAEEGFEMAKASPIQYISRLHQTLGGRTDMRLMSEIIRLNKGTEYESSLQKLIDRRRQHFPNEKRTEAEAVIKKWQTTIETAAKARASDDKIRQIKPYELFNAWVSGMMTQKEHSVGLGLPERVAYASPHKTKAHLQRPKPKQIPKPIINQQAKGKSQPHSVNLAKWFEKAKENGGKTAHLRAMQMYPNYPQALQHAYADSHLLDGLRDEEGNVNMAAVEGRLLQGFAVIDWGAKQVMPLGKHGVRSHAIHPTKSRERLRYSYANNVVVLAQEVHDAHKNKAGKTRQEIRDFDQRNRTAGFLQVLTGANANMSKRQGDKNRPKYGTDNDPFREIFDPELHGLVGHFFDKRREEGSGGMWEHFKKRYGKPYESHVRRVLTMVKHLDKKRFANEIDNIGASGRFDPRVVEWVKFHVSGVPAVINDMSVFRKDFQDQIEGILAEFDTGETPPPSETLVRSLPNRLGRRPRERTQEDEKDEPQKKKHKPFTADVPPVPEKTPDQMDDSLVTDTTLKYWENKLLRGTPAEKDEARFEVERQQALLGRRGFGGSSVAPSPEETPEPSEGSRSRSRSKPRASRSRSESTSWYTLSEESERLIAGHLPIGEDGAILPFTLQADVPIDASRYVPRHFVVSRPNNRVYGQVSLVRPGGGAEEDHFMYELEQNMVRDQVLMVEQARRGPFKAQTGRSRIVHSTANTVYRRRGSNVEITVTRKATLPEITILVAKINAHGLYNGRSYLTLLMRGSTHRMGPVVGLNLDLLKKQILEGIKKFGSIGILVTDVKNGPLSEFKVHNYDFASDVLQRKSMFGV